MPPTPRTHSWLLRTVLLGFAATTSLASASPAQDAGWQKEITTWRAGHAADLQKPDGWLALAGLEWLETGDNSFGSAKDNTIHLPASAPEHLGVLHLEGETVTLTPPPGGFPSGFLIDGKPVQAQALHTDPDHDKNNPRLTIATLNVYVIHRGDKFALRIKDAKSAALITFHGLKWYPPNGHYRVTAKWMPYNPQKTYTLERLVGAPYPAQIPGSAEFTLDGKTLRLDPILEDPAVAKLFFVLRDTTSAKTTYGACRFLYTGFPDHGLEQPGELVLDFNRLENPPCAYTPYATCPLPPRQNRLPIALPVGELRYHE
ncbi:MAG TPA: DUF1684 domain-containing protein [Micropepsaceae bacterium]|nr:DUF1684 domain-containing protein [Micropepsaceae bacterium]